MGPCYRPPPTLPDGLRFDGDAICVAAGSVHPEVASRRMCRRMELVMAAVNGHQGIREAYTFDDVLLKPGLSDILPSEADIRSHVTRAIPLNIPIIASAMDTVTEARMAIAMAQAGGIGVIHRNFDVEGQGAQVRQVEKVESGMGVHPVPMGPDAALADAPKLVGLYASRVGRFATNPRQKFSELMPHENIVTVRGGVSQAEAKRMLNKH